MQVISQRVSKGEDIRPRPPPRKPKKKSSKTETDASKGKFGEKSEDSDRRNEVDWRKWGSRVAVAKSWARQGHGAVRTSSIEVSWV